MRQLLVLTVSAAAVTLVGCADQETTDAGPAFALEQPDNVTVQQSGTSELEVKIDREEGFGQPVSLEFSKLPEGVTIQGTQSISAAADEATVIVSAGPDASVTQDHEVTVTASAEGVEERRQFFRVSVEAGAAGE